MSELPTGRRKSRGANGDGGGRQRPDGLWEWRITVPGTHRRVSAFGRTKAEARLKCREKLIKEQAGVDTKGGRQTLGAFLERWLAEVVEVQRAPKTYESYRDTVRNHVIPTLGQTRLDRLTAQQVQALLRAKEREGKLSARSVAYIREVLRVALNRAIKWNLVTTNAAALADPPKRERHERTILTPEQAEAFLRAVEGDRLEAFYLLIATLGLRRGEALALRWQDVDLDTGTLRVRQTLQRVGRTLHFKEPKTEKSRRTLALPAVVVDALRRHRDRQTLEATSPNWADHGLVFPNTRGAPYDPNNVLARFQRTLAAAGLPNQRLHDLRHYAAAFLLSKGVQMRVVMDILGHARMATTADLYAHVLPAAHREVAELIDESLRPKTQEAEIR